jgi:hypothetical protein
MKINFQSMKKTSLFAFYASLVLLSFSCVNVNEKIILTTGLCEVPNKLRFGIELSPHDLYYCEEIRPLSGQYNYFHAKFNSHQFKKIKNDLLKVYDKIDTSSFVDGMTYELITIFNDKKSVKRFAGPQVKEIKNIENCRKMEMEKIKYHEFPKELLEKKRMKFIPPTIIDAR